MRNKRLWIVFVTVLGQATGAASPAGAATEAKTTYRFDFGPGEVAAGYLQVLPTTVYDANLGYGFLDGSAVQAVDRGGSDALTRDFCMSDKPFYFSVKLPEGNYWVTVTLGDPCGESVTTIKAELRRLMLEQVRTRRGELATRVLAANVRTPAIAGGGEVRLKDRERTSEAWAWDDRLTLEFNGGRPCICALEVAKADDLPTLYLLGDSTVCDQPLEPWNSWGHPWNARAALQAIPCATIRKKCERWLGRTTWH
jgi:hypothetical protein